MSTQGWIGVDLDATLAHYDKWRGSEHIGEPIPEMLARVKRWIDDGIEVRVFTARVSPMSCKVNNETPEVVRGYIDKWCIKHLGVALTVTHEKDMAMFQLWDDRCVQVIPNTGVRADGQ